MSETNCAKTSIAMRLTINGKFQFFLLSTFSLQTKFDSLHGVKENVADLQQRLQQYQKKNDEMHEKIATLERKVPCLILVS
jgi:cell division protein FtsB